ncbi:MAG: chemotaxis protein CheB [Ignavibacteria bacterium]|nr:chemotaxis protein CheB [Ignavibacteria bacterium]
MKKPNGSKRGIKSEKKIMPIDTPAKKVFNKSEFPVVGIGASAGGLEALEQFITNIPENSGMAFIIVQHLDPTHKGLLTEILQRLTKIKVFQITDNMKIKPNSIYVIPPNRDLSIFKRTLHLFEMSERRGLRLPIDHFFKTLAENEGDRSIAVILSGMGSDGTLGLTKIKEHGGIVFVQDPGLAKFDGMPRSAVDAGLANVVLPANEIPPKIFSILKHNLSGLPEMKSEGRNQTALEKIIILLRSHTGHDFSLYKKNTMYRRIERRMSIHQIDSMVSYVHYLQENAAELQILFKEMLIGVTNFFRDPEVWEILSGKILPELISKSPAKRILRAWVPACSTGEEAYSLAIAFKEAVSKQEIHKNIALQIFATDIDGDAVEKARRGAFSVNIASEITAERINRFFAKEENGFRVRKEIREMIIFAQQNLIMDPPFTKLDILSCRNLLIYLEPELQKKIFPLFHYSLLPEGILILGNAESVGEYSNLFNSVYSKERIFRRSEEIFRQSSLIISPASSKQKKAATEIIPQMKETDNLQSLVEKLLFQKFSPSAVLVNDKGDILYVTGSTGKYLEPASGKANWNIFAMLREGLRKEIYSAFQTVLRRENETTVKNLRTDSSGVRQVVDITIQYITKPDELNGLLILFFNDVTEPIDIKKPVKGTSKKKSEQEQECNRLKEELRAALEEMQTSQEEHKSTNEELQSTNEELQSTNEELTTSKEEMQSLNEELQTLNAELQSKIDDLSRSNNDMKNLFNSTDIATLFLDNDLNIRRFTMPATKITKLIPGDIGRPISDLTTVLIYPDLIEDAKEVLRTLKFSEKTIYSKDDKCYLVRIMLYRTLENKIDGLVITFTDITKAKILEAELVETSILLRSLIKTAPNVTLCLSTNGHIVEFNTEAEKLFGKKREDVIDKKFTDIFILPPLRKKVDEDFAKFFTGGTNGRLETKVYISESNVFRIEWFLNKLFKENGQVAGIVVFAQKILKE